MEPPSELSGSPQAGRETPETAPPPSAATTSIRHRSRSRGPTSRRPDDMGRSAGSSPRPVTERNYESNLQFKDLAAAIIRLFSNLIKNFFSLLKDPLNWVFFIYLAAVFTYTFKYTQQASLCSIPGVARFKLLHYCMPRYEDSDQARKPPLLFTWSLFTRPQYPVPNFRQLTDLQESYSDILESLETGAIAGVHLQAAHASIIDISIAVQLSKLKSEEIMFYLKKFADEAKAAASELNRLRCKVRTEIDILVSINMWTLNRLQEARKREAEIEDSKFTSGITGFILAPFRAAEMQVIQREVRDTFLRASQKVETSLKNLKKHADYLVRSLKGLDERLISLHKSATEADVELVSEQENILESLWSRFCHRKDLNRYESQRKQLEDVTKYRGVARNIVQDTYQSLENMLAYITGLRAAISRPFVKKDKEEEGDGKGEGQSQGGEMVVVGSPLEVHIEVVMTGVKRLIRERDRAEVRFREDLERAGMEVRGF